MKVRRLKGKGKRRGRGIGRLLRSPLVPVLIGLAIVLGIGSWMLRDTPPKQQVTAAGGEAGSAVEPAKSGAATTTEPVKETEKPPERPKEPATPPKEAQGGTEPVEGRSRIDRSGGADKTMLMTIYYADAKAGGNLQPVQVQVERQLGVIANAAQQVLNPPRELALESGVPAGTKVRGANLNKETGVATVDLTAEAGQVQGSAAAQTMMASLVYSLTNIQGVNAVQVWVEGRPAVLHGIEWDKPISRSEMEARGLFSVAPVIEFKP